MKQVRRIKFGSGTKAIYIYKVDAERAALVDIEYTDIYGILRWMPPSNGTYNLICETEQRHNVVGMVVTSSEGAGDSFNYPIM
ncbi:MAG: hypothetical protein Q8M92_05045 [Candidatus Subteraquimicrobiales bacterium]|nr:hypothetical protein [Candidatus Subteraquimicrobiales bacterium]